MASYMLNIHPYISRKSFTLKYGILDCDFRETSFAKYVQNCVSITAFSIKTC